MDEENAHTHTYTHTHTHTPENYSVIKKNEMSFTRKEMELEIIMLNEICKTQKDKYCLFSLICRIQIFKKCT
jgi:hypothetical protein